MIHPDNPICFAFAGDRHIAAGPLAEVALAVRETIDDPVTANVLIFDQASRIVDVDWRGSIDDLRHRLAAVDPTGATAPSPAPPPTDAASEPPQQRKRGRPKLGVVGREVTLLPRHWDWLASQPGSASVTLRKLVDQARRTSVEKDRRRSAQESAYRFMVTMAGDATGFEEATRALFAADGEKFTTETSTWPPDVRDHAKHLASAVFGT